ncbi:fibronectin-like [Amphiura filiformis]|uniref:fibronectin-like n=1 Tax=Amphiura filiformis TaxID=82378 RepID=UPI003B21C176
MACTQSIKQGPLPPGELAIEDFGSTTITVSWGPALDPAATGYSLTAVPVSGGQNAFRNVGITTTQATFTGLDPGTNYLISLSIDNVAGSSTQISQYTRPNRPGSITIVETTQTRILIRWSPAIGNFDEYVVTFASGDNQEEIITTVPRGAELSAEVDELNPDTIYTFNVYAVVSSDNIRSAPSTRDIRTDDEVLLFEKISSRELKVSWPSLSTTLDYEIFYTPPDGDQPNPVTTSAREITYGDLTPGKHYEFKLYTIDASGNRNLWDVASYVMPPLRPDITQITCRATICYLWVNSPDGIYDILVVIATPLIAGQGTGTQGTTTVIYPRDGCPYIIVTGLTPNTNYLFEVTAQSGRLALSPTDSQQQSTEIVNPGELYIEQFEPHSLTVAWIPVDADNIASYILAAYNEATGILVRSTQVLPGSTADFSWMISNVGSNTGQIIQPGELYQITLNTRNANGNDITNDVIQQYTKPLAPLELYFTQSSGNTVMLTWTPTIGNKDGYEICYGPDGNIFTVQAGTTSYQLTVADPSTQYAVSVAAYVGDGPERTRSDRTTRFLTLDDGLPGDITIVDVTTTSIEISWTEALGSTVTGYQVSIESVINGGTPTPIPVAISAAREYEFFSLQSCTEYLIKVTFLGTNPLLVRSKTQLTRPGQPFSLAALNADALTILISWTANGNADFYNVEIKDSGTSDSEYQFVDQVDGSLTQYTIQDLAPSTSYRIRLTAQCGTTESNRAVSTPRETTASTTGLPLCTIVITDKSTSSLETQWGQCQGITTYYLDIKPRPPGSGIWPKPLVAASLDSLIYTFTGLDPGRLYTVLLGTDANQPPQSTDTAYTTDSEFVIGARTVVGYGDFAEQSEDETRVVQTLVLQENQLAVTGCTTSSIILAVGASTLNDLQGYIIDINPAPSNPLQQNPVYIPDNVNNLQATFEYLSPGVLYTFSLRVARTLGSTPVLDNIVQRTSKPLLKCHLALGFMHGQCFYP